MQQSRRKGLDLNSASQTKIALRLLTFECVFKLATETVYKISIQKQNSSYLVKWFVINIKRQKHISRKGGKEGCNCFLISGGITLQVPIKDETAVQLQRCRATVQPVTKFITTEIKIVK